MKNIPLHWQILIALVLAIAYGLIFPTKYKLTAEDFEVLKLEYPEMTEQIQDLKEITYSTSKKLDDSIISTIGKENLEKSFRSTASKLSYHNPAVNLIHWLGLIFLRALKMLVIPLILSSIMSGIVNITGEGKLGRLGFKTLTFYVVSSTLAIITGLTMVNIFKPGAGTANSDLVLQDIAITPEQKDLKDLLIEIVPQNIFESLANNELLSIIFFAIVSAIFITKLNDKSRRLLTNFIQASFELCMKLTMFIIKLAPFGIFGLVAKVVADQSDFPQLMKDLGTFMIAVTAALLIHAFVVLPLVTFFVGKAKPFQHFRNMGSALLTAFSTASSAAALPLTMDSVNKRSGVSTRITNFTLPIGATVNMDGTAIYICAVVMFIAQRQGMEMGPKEQMIILLTALLTSIGTAAIPMASLVIITIILDIFNLPFELIALILPVDRLLDMLRTSVNVWSDSCGAVVIAKSEGEQLNV